MTTEKHLGILAKELFIYTEQKEASR